MKKLMSKALNFGAKEVLTREQLKKVLGGAGGGGCGLNFDKEKTVTCPPGNTPAGCLPRPNNYWEPYCYVDSSGTCYSVGAASCS